MVLFVCCSGGRKQHLVGPGHEGYVVTGSGSASWTPTATQISTLEERLKALRPTVTQDGQPVRLDLSRYLRQYVGLWDGGRRIIQIRFFCPRQSQLASDPNVVTRGGGSCFLRTTYDVDAGLFTSFLANSGR
jgi:hypothetical protein